jgi:mono/diheme cytochrome c family protein
LSFRKRERIVVRPAIFTKEVSMLQVNIGRRVGVWVAALALVAFAAPVALAHTSAAPKLVGSPAAGKTVFSSTCITCHALKAVPGGGSIGPNLDKVGPALDEATIIKAVTCGGASVMTKAAVAKYTTTMAPYAPPALTQTQITNVAAFIFSTTHPKGSVPKVAVSKTLPKC